MKDPRNEIGDESNLEAERRGGFSIGVKGLGFGYDKRK